MSVNDLIVRVFTLLMAVGLIVLLFNFSLSPYEKWRFNNTCDQSFKELIANGELTSSQKNMLIAKLTNRGLTNIKVTVKNSSWGDEISLLVTGSLQIKNGTYEETFTLEYDNATYSLVLR